MKHTIYAMFFSNSGQLTSKRLAFTGINQQGKPITQQQRWDIGSNNIKALLVSKFH